MSAEEATDCTMNFDDTTTIGTNPITVWALNIVGSFLTVLACMGYSSVRLRARLRGVVWGKLSDVGAKGGGGGPGCGQCVGQQAEAEGSG